MKFTVNELDKFRSTVCFSEDFQCMEEYDNWHCTRKKGHTGIHIAHGLHSMPVFLFDNNNSMMV